MSDGRIKLHYFNGRGRMEVSRYILHYAGREFEDYRIEMSEWPSLKSCYPNGQLPMLEIEKNGQKVTLSQSVAIARCLARRFGLTGANEFEASQCDEIVDSINDLINETVTAVQEKDADRKETLEKKLKNESCPRVLGTLERRLKKNGGKFIVGKQWTWADFAIATFINGILRMAVDADAATEKMPGLCGLTKRVESIPEIAAWIAVRPETKF